MRNVGFMHYKISTLLFGRLRLFVVVVVFLCMLFVHFSSLEFCTGQNQALLCRLSWPFSAGTVYCNSHAMHLLEALNPTTVKTTMTACFESHGMRLNLEGWPQYSV